MTAPFRFPRFFVTSPSPCPYLPGKQERKVFTELTGPQVEKSVIARTCFLGVPPVPSPSLQEGLA